NILSPGLVEADAGLVVGVAEGAGASNTEAPRPQETRHGGKLDRMVVEVGRQGVGVPAAGIKVELVAGGAQASRQGGDVHLAAAPGRQDALVTECEVHDISSRLGAGPASLFSGWSRARSAPARARGGRYARSRGKDQGRPSFPLPSPRWGER